MLMKRERNSIQGKKMVKYTTIAHLLLTDAQPSSKQQSVQPGQTPS